MIIKQFLVVRNNAAFNYCMGKKNWQSWHYNMLICWFRLKQISTKSSLMMLLLTNEIWWPSISGCFDKLEVEVLYYELFNVMTINTHMFDFSQPNNKRIFIFKDPHPHPPLKKIQQTSAPVLLNMLYRPCHVIAYMHVCVRQSFSPQ